MGETSEECKVRVEERTNNHSGAWHMFEMTRTNTWANVVWHIITSAHKHEKKGTCEVYCLQQAAGNRKSWYPTCRRHTRRTDLGQAMGLIPLPSICFPPQAPGGLPSCTLSTQRHQPHRLPPRPASTKLWRISWRSFSKANYDWMWSSIATSRLSAVAGTELDRMLKSMVSRPQPFSCSAPIPLTIAMSTSNAPASHIFPWVTQLTSVPSAVVCKKDRQRTMPGVAWHWWWVTCMNQTAELNWHEADVLWQQ